MQTLLNMFEESEKFLLDTDNTELQKLKKIRETRKGRTNSKRFKFEIKTILSIMKGFKNGKIELNTGKEERKLKKLEFNPTITQPDIIITDEEAKSYSVWYHPIIYVPSKNSAKKIQPEFVFLKGEKKSMYDIDKKFKRSLYTYEFLSDSLLKKISEEMMERIHKPQLVIHARREYKYSDLTNVVDSKHYLDPNELLVVSEKEVPEKIKMNLPVGVDLSEKVDLNTRRLREKVKKLLK